MERAVPRPSISAIRGLLLIPRVSEVLERALDGRARFRKLNGIGLAVGEISVVPLTELEAELRHIARERIARGMLPGRPSATRMWAGYGNGRLCDLCGKPIQAGEIEYEVEHPDHAVTTLRFHLVCQSVWQLECARNDHLAKHGSTGTG
jgi:hypothetical protein